MTHEKIKGKWWQIKKTKNIKKIKSKYDKIKDWKIDPNGYFLIDIDRDLLHNAYYNSLSDIME